MTSGGNRGEHWPPSTDYREGGERAVRGATLGHAVEARTAVEVSCFIYSMRKAVARCWRRRAACREATK